jgi:glutaredoxin
MPNSNTQSTKKATLYRMVMEDHLCPYGLKAKDLLERKGYKVDDQWLTSKKEDESFKNEHDVKTTPQAFIDGERIGGYDALRKHFGQDVLEEGNTTYRPVLVIFLMALLVSLAFSWQATRSIISLNVAESFIALSMCLLALQKLKDVEGFSTMFLNYDLLAKKWVRYGYVYPYAEGLAGVLMLAGTLPFVSGSLALTIGTIGAVSVIKAVYVDKRELKCACVGGDTNVPLGAISLTENLMMMLMGIWTIARYV